jgi:hypothetical protein
MFQNNLLMAAASAGGTGSITIENSILLNDDDSQVLTRTPVTTGNTKIGTMSFWYKRCDLASIRMIVNCDNNAQEIQFNATDQIRVLDTSGTGHSNLDYETTQVFRDTTAWGHLVFAWNTTLAAAGDRFRIYHNGIEITAFDNETAPDLNSDMPFSRGGQLQIGANESDAQEYDGYLSDFYFIDGYRLEPTSFGSFDSNGVWRPQTYSASTTTPAISHVSNAVDAVNRTTYTFSSQALGAAAADRRIVVVAGGGGGSIGTTSAVTVGGVSATQVAEYTDGTNISAIWWAEVPTGTTGDVVVTFSVTKGDCGIVCYRLTGADTVLSTATTGTGTSSPESFSGTVGTPNNAVVVAGVFWAGTDQVTTTWTGDVTEDVDQVVEDAALADKMQSTASTTSSGTTVIATCTPSASTSQEAMTVASFGSSAYGVNGFHLDFSDENVLGKDAAVEVSTTTYRYFKIDVTLAGTSYVSIGEMEYFVGSTAHPTSNMTSNTAPSPLVASANSDTGTGAQLAFNAFDGSEHPTVSKWQTANGTNTGFLKIDLGSGNEIAPDRIGIFAPETESRTPRTFTIQGSNNDSDYTVLTTYTSLPTWGNEEKRYLPLTNGNNFFAKNVTSANQVTDTPTDNFPTLFRDASVTLNEGNLQVDTLASTAWKCIPATVRLPTTGKWCWEVEMVSANGVIQAGFCGEVLKVQWGSGTIAQISDNYVSYYIGYGESAQDVDGSQTDAGGLDSLTQGEKLQMIVDQDAGTMAYYSEGVLQKAWTGNNVFAFCYVMMYGDSYGTPNIKADFGQHGFTRVDEDYNYISTANFPEPTILDSTKNFQTTLYTGNGSERNIDQTGNRTFQPDWVWLKNRSQADSSKLVDIARGVEKEISSDSTAAETTDSDGLTSFDSDGFGLGSGAGGYNDNTENFVAWQWLAGGGAGSSNTTGSINTTTTTVNTTSGLSISTYTGDGISGATIGHGLGAVPTMILIKKRNVLTQWTVYHQFNTTAPETEYLVLDKPNATTDYAGAWNDTAPSSTVITLGNDSVVNQSLATYVAYAFADVEGFSKMGMYRGNGGVNGSAVIVGFKPAFLLIKSSGASQNWLMYDSSRSPYNEVDDQLTANDATAETTGSEEIDILATGFKCRTNDGALNTAGHIYIYAAFASHPFGGGEDVTPATAF